jgi:undecaprenyl-diphosphatase
MSIPAIFASGMFELIAEWDHLAELGWGSIALAVFVSFVSGWLSIAFLLRYLRTHTTTVFILYRIVLGIALIGLLLGGVLQAQG